MTELNQKNREIYLDVCKTVWNLDDESLEYIKHRTSDEWEPAPELKALIGINGSTYEDQRIRFDVDMSDPTVQSLFQKEDESYSIFKNKFRHVLLYLSENGTPITYSDFIANKVVYNKNVTKIKKVFETVYKNNLELFAADFGLNDESLISNAIVKAFEKVGASKKSGKKLQFVISFNPMDWLLASTAEKFSSCFNINNASGGYQYCLGLPFLCGDKNRVMLYISNGCQKECMGIKVESVQTRTWAILEEVGKIAIVKWYPNDTIGVNPVNAITKTNLFISRDQFYKGKYPIDMLSTKKGVCIGVYSDMGKWVYENGKLWHKGNGKDGQQWFTNRGTPLHEDRNRSYSSYRLEANMGNFFGISNKGYCLPVWKSIGFNVDMMFHEATCVSCNKEKTGFFTNIKETHKFYCKDCYVDNIYTCGICGKRSFKPKDSLRVETTGGDFIDVCDSCVDKIDERTCSCCGKVCISGLRRATDGNKVCNKCFESGKYGYCSCDNCGNISKNIEIKRNTFSKLQQACCENCLDSSNIFEDITTFGREFRIITRSSVPRGQIE